MRRRKPVPEPPRTVLGVCGSSMAAITPDLVDMLHSRRPGGLAVIVTPDARRFVPRLRTTVYDDTIWQYTPLHVTLTANADLFVIAPATANTLAKIATGVADNLLTATIIAARTPIMIFPAMNAAMWNAAPVQRNVDRIRADGHWLAQPMDCESASTGVLGDAVGFDVEFVEQAIAERGLINR